MNVPTSMDSFEFLAGFKERIPEGMEGDREAQIAFVKEKMAENEDRGVFADMRIWQNKPLSIILYFVTVMGPSQG